MTARELEGVEVVALRIEQGRDKYVDLDKDLDDLLQGRASGEDLMAMIEKHQIRVSPMQRRALLYLMNGTARMRRYAYMWLDVAGREGNAADFILGQQAKTLAIPEMNRSLNFSPNGGA